MIDNVIKDFQDEPDPLEIIELHDFLKLVIMIEASPEVTDVMRAFCHDMYVFTAIMSTIENLSIEERSSLLARAISASNEPDYDADTAVAILDEFEATRDEKSNLEGTSEGVRTYLDKYELLWYKIMKIFIEKGDNLKDRQCELPHYCKCSTPRV